MDHTFHLALPVLMLFVASSHCRAAGGNINLGDEQSSGSSAEIITVAGFSEIFGTIKDGIGDAVESVSDHIDDLQNNDEDAPSTSEHQESKKKALGGDVQLFGLSRDENREIQELLATLSYSPGPADGLPGSKTQTAIRQFQSDVGLKVDGIPSDILLTHLRNQVVALKGEPQENPLKTPPSPLENAVKAEPKIVVREAADSERVSNSNVAPPVSVEDVFEEDSVVQELNNANQDSAVPFESAGISGEPGSTQDLNAQAAETSVPDSIVDHAAKANGSAPVVNVLMPFVAPTGSSELPRKGTIQLKLKDGSVLRGIFKPGNTPFASAFGEIPLSTDQIAAFSNGTLRLKDGNVLKGSFLSTDVGFVGEGGEKVLSTSNIQEILLPKTDSLTTSATSPEPGRKVLFGRVLDNFGNPVAGATLSISDSKFVVQTDMGGRYELPFVPGRLQVRIAHEGFDEEFFTLDLAKAVSFPVEDKVIFKSPPSEGIYLWGQSDWKPLAKCTVVQTKKDSGNFSAGGTNASAARGEPSLIESADSISFIASSANRNGLKLYRLEDGETLAEFTRSGGFPGLFQMTNGGGSGGGTTIDLDQRLVGRGRPVLSGYLALGTYAFVRDSQGIGGVEFYREPCFKIRITRTETNTVARESDRVDSSNGGVVLKSRTRIPAGSIELSTSDTESLLALDRDQRRIVQTWLNALEFDVGRADGVFGGKTRLALADYERSLGLQGTGFLSQGLYERLEADGSNAIAESVMMDTKDNMVRVPDGCFNMEEADTGKSKRVCFDNLYIGKHEVTNKEFRQFVELTGYRTDTEMSTGGLKGCGAQSQHASTYDHTTGTSWRKPNPKGGGTSGNMPVRCVSWNDAAAYASWLSELTNMPFRLPTNAEWQYVFEAGRGDVSRWPVNSRNVCRYGNVADSTKRRVSGGTMYWPERANCSDGYYNMAPVGRYRPALGEHST